MKQIEHLDTLLLKSLLPYTVAPRSTLIAIGGLSAYKKIGALIDSGLIKEESYESNKNKRHEFCSRKYLKLTKAGLRYLEKKSALPICIQKDEFSLLPKSYDIERLTHIQEVSSLMNAAGVQTECCKRKALSFTKEIATLSDRPCLEELYKIQLQADESALPSLYTRKEGDVYYNKGLIKSGNSINYSTHTHFLISDLYSFTVYHSGRDGVNFANGIVTNDIVRRAILSDFGFSVKKDFRFPSPAIVICSSKSEFKKTFMSTTAKKKKARPSKIIHNPCFVIPSNEEGLLLLKAIVKLGYTTHDILLKNLLLQTKYMGASVIKSLTIDFVIKNEVHLLAFDLNMPAILGFSKEATKDIGKRYVIHCTEKQKEFLSGIISQRISFETDNLLKMLPSYLTK